MKISIIGVGQIGSTVANMLVTSKICNQLALVDLKPNLAAALKTDLQHAASMLKKQIEIKASDVDYSITANSDIIITTASIARPVNMTYRTDMLEANSQILSDIAQKIKRYSKNSIVIIISNPLDLMTYLTWRVTGLQKEKIIGMGCSLDQARYEFFIQQQLNINPGEVISTVLGVHGENLILDPNLTLIKGEKLSNILTKKEIEEIHVQTRNSGARLGNMYAGSPWIGPTHAILDIVKAISMNKKKVISVSTILNGEYGYKNIAVGVPCVIGRNGVEQIIEVEIDKDEIDRVFGKISKLESKLDS